MADAHGATLLLGEGRAPAPDAPFGQVLRGTLGERQAVTVWVQPRRDDGSVSGVYFYDRFRRPILLFGQARDGALELDESESGGRWRLQREGPSLRGTWTGGTKQLPVVLAP